MESMGVPPEVVLSQLESHLDEILELSERMPLRLGVAADGALTGHSFDNTFHTTIGDPMSLDQ